MSDPATTDSHPLDADEATRAPLHRRAFLKGCAVAGVAAAGAASSEWAQAEPAEPTADARRGYRETPHIRQYYKAARF